MSNITAPVDDLRGMSDDDLIAAYHADPDDELTRTRVLAECARRDRAARDQAEREQVYAAWHGAAYSDYLTAEAECRGELVSRRGVAAGVRDGFALWAGPRWVADLYATEELRDWWDLHPRLTITEYRRQLAAQARAAREEWQAALDAAVSIEVSMMAVYRGVLRVRTPGAEAVEVVECPHVAYSHETEEAALACARKMARDRGLPVAV